MRLAFGLILLATLGSSSWGQERRHPPGLRAEMVLTGRVDHYNGKTFTLTTSKSGTYTIRIVPNTIIKVPAGRGRYGLRKGAAVTAQGFVHERIIDATKITVLERLPIKSK